MAITIKNLHKDLPEDQLHEAKGFTTASNNTYLKKNQDGSSEWLAEYWLEPVLGVVTGASAPPTESAGHRYILTGSSFNAGWDSPAQHEIVEFDGTSWVGIAAVDGMRVVDLSDDSVYYFNTAWNQVTDANTNTTYTISAVDSGSDAIIRLTAGGSGSGDDDVTLVAGTNMTITPSGDNITLASSQTESIILSASDETTALTTGTAKMTFRMPYAFTLSAVRASLTTAGSTSGTTTIDINEGGSTILSTKLTIDSTEKTSTTAATAAVISDTALADDAEITIDIDAVSGGGTEKGLKVTLIGTKA